LSLRRRLWLAMAGVVALGVGLALYVLVDDLRPRHLATMEESLVDTAHVLAHVAALHWDDEETLGSLLTPSLGLPVAAQVYELSKDRWGLSVNVYDDQGIVRIGEEPGADHSQWNDVVRTLRGEYGARATRIDPDDALTTVLHVAAPVRIDGETVGVLSVAKDQRDIDPFLATTRRTMALALAYAGLGMVLLAALLTVWTTRPLRRLLDHVEAVGRDRQAVLPHLGPSDLRAVGAAFEAMRERLEGKQYVEQYVSALGHELKSPLAAIRGASELLAEDPAQEHRQRFIANLLRESQRCERLLDQLLRLAALERQGRLEGRESCDLSDLARSAIGERGDAVESVDLETPLLVSGEPGLLRLAIANLLANACTFGPGTVTVTAAWDGDEAVLQISDRGPGIPAYAREKIFDRFFSLPRSDGSKSTGLGLALVREIMELHGGSVTVSAGTDGSGVIASLRLPRFS
jgi:two-component system sensor histidine kinase CreC